MLSGFVVIPGTAVLRPDVNDARIITIPATRVKVRMNPPGVGLFQLVQALSISKALIRKAPPRMLTRTANICVVSPSTVPIPPIS